MHAGHFPLRRADQMDDSRILALAIETLENHRADVELEIEAIGIMMKERIAQGVPGSTVSSGRRPYTRGKARRRKSK